MPAQRTKKFRFNARYAFLTYSQCAVPPESITEHLSKIGKSHSLYQEKHKDDGIHYHAVVDFGSQKNIRGERFFDVGESHPNVQSVRSLKNTLEYISKDGCHISGTLTTNGIWRDIADSSSRQEFFDLLKKEQPQRLITSYINVRAYADDTFRPPKESYTPPSCAFVEPPAVTKWLETEFFEDNR